MTDDDDTTEHERGRGILSAADRAFLRAEPGEYGNSRQVRNTREQAVEDRLRNAIADFPVLLTALANTDRREIFAAENLEDEEQQNRVTEIQDMVAFAYLCSMDLHTDFETVIENAIWRVSERTGVQLTGVDVTIELDQLDPYTDQLKERVRNPDPDNELSDAELLLLIERGVIDSDDALIYRQEIRALR